MSSKAFEQGIYILSNAQLTEMVVEAQDGKGDIMFNLAGFWMLIGEAILTRFIGSEVQQVCILPRLIPRDRLRYMAKHSGMSSISAASYTPFAMLRRRSTWA
jgi:hypothetical protein